MFPTSKAQDRWRGLDLSHHPFVIPVVDFHIISDLRMRIRRVPGNVRQSSSDKWFRKSLLIGVRAGG